MISYVITCTLKPSRLELPSLLIEVLIEFYCVELIAEDIRSTSFDQVVQPV